MAQPTALPLLLGTALLAASCSSGVRESPTNPTAFATGSSVSISAQALAPAQAATITSCPAPAPLMTPFIVTVTPTGRVGVFVTSITTQFTDFVAVPMPAVTLPAPVPTTQFGSALEQARSPQAFSFNVCRPAKRGKVAVTVDTRDTLGRSASGTVTVAVE